MEQREGKMLELLRGIQQEGTEAIQQRTGTIFQKVLNQEYRLAGKPQVGVLELTPICNLDCKMCYVHLRPEQMKERTLIPAKQWIAWIDEAISLGMQGVQLTGGEAMMHPDFDEIYLHLREQGIRVTVMTNGLLLNEKRIAFFKKNPPTSIQVTMYGGSEEGYEKVTGHRGYEAVKQHLLAAKEIGSRLVVTMTPSRYFGKEDALAVQKFTRDNDINLIINNDLNEPRGDTGRVLSQFNLSLEEYMDIYRALFVKLDDPVPLDTLPQPGNCQESCNGLQCGAGRSMFCITWEGEMKACFDLPEGISLRGRNLTDVWQEINDMAEAYCIPSECGDCEYRTVCNLCPAVHMQNAPRGHVDRFICNRTRHLVAEGLSRLETKVEDKEDKKQKGVLS